MNKNKPTGVAAANHLLEVNTLKILDILQSNPADHYVRISRPESADSAEAFMLTIFEGRIADVPPELYDTDVQQVGWLMVADIASITISYDALQLNSSIDKKEETYATDQF